MIEEVVLLGIYAPAALVWAVLAVVMVWLIRPALLRLPLARLVWQPALVDIALFIAVWWGLSALADTFLPAWIAHHS